MNPTFVFQPGGVAAGNVYTDWPTMMTDVNALAGPKAIEVNAGLALATVPLGTWNVDDVTFVGSGIFGGPASTLHFADGAHFEFSRLTLDYGVRFDSSSLSPVAAPGPSAVIFLHRASSLATSMSGSAPWMQVSNLVAVIVDTLSSIGGVAPAITVDASKTVNVFLLGDSRLVNNVVTGAGTLFLLYADESTAGLTQLVTTVITVLLSLASALKYVAGAPANWATPAPTTVANALDRLAAKLALP